MKTSFFTNNRENFFRLMEDESILILDSNQPLYGNEDEVFPFVQSNDFIYLSGIKEAGSKLLLYKNVNLNEANQAILFLAGPTQEKKIWEGNPLSRPKAEAISGLASIKNLSEFEKNLQLLIPKVKHIYLNSNENLRRVGEDYHSKKIIKKIKSQFPLHNFKRANPLFQSLRSIKSPEEINQIKKAIQITKNSLIKTIPYFTAGGSEREIERELAYWMSKESNQSIKNIFAFPPIIASGKNACTLHYTNNNATLKEGDLILLDVGSRFGLYGADITRVFPILPTSKKISKKRPLFSNRQKELYSGLLKAQKKIIQLIRPGLSFKSYNEKAKTIMEDLLIELDLIKERKDYPTYFMHGVSHSLGLAVHDNFDYNSVMKEGMVLTCEPGIYIREENIGLRIEDNIHITAEGAENLSSEIPKELAEIEALSLGLNALE